MKKYKLGPKETFSQGGTFIRAHRITALINIPAHDVKIGDLGGWVESRRNLSHDGDCWIGQNAVVADSCRVKDDALVTGNATLMSACKVSGNSIIKDNAFLSGLVNVTDNVAISGKTSIIAPEYYDAPSGYDISENVQISGSPKIVGHGFIKGAARITGTPNITYVEMSGASTISGDSSVHYCTLEDSAQIFDSAEVWRTWMTGNTKIYGKASITTGTYHTLLTGNATVCGNARIFGSRENRATSMSGDVSVYGDAIVREGCKISGETILNESAHLLEYCEISGRSTVSGPVPLPVRYKASDMTQDINGIKTGQKGLGRPLKNNNSNTSDQNRSNANYLGAYNASPISAASKKRTASLISKAESSEPPAKAIEPIRLELAEIVEKVEKDYDAYKNDVVKLIKYPTMVDLKDELTLNFTFALRKAKREISYGQNSEKMEESVEMLERAFLAAESNAQKIGASNYSEHEVKKTETAKQMLAVALDEQASENERRISFKQAFKILEGIIAVPDSAVETMKIQVGLKELEA
jgi:carbonic anhydrase/acetyltransferase-like protein (isoleucine patch superfamily)